MLGELACYECQNFIGPPTREEVEWMEQMEEGYREWVAQLEAAIAAGDVPLAEELYELGK